MSQSEIAKLREKIALEYQSARRVFTQFTPTARHEYITKRQEAIADCFTELSKYMGGDEAMIMIIQVECEIEGIPMGGSL